MQDATSEAQMIERAQERLSEIFQAEARVILDTGADGADKLPEVYEWIGRE